MKHYKFDKNRNRVKYCPCGKKNNNKFSPIVGFEDKGRCFSCDKFFHPNEDKSIVSIPNYKYEPPKIINYFDYSLVSKSGRNFKENNFILFVKSLVGTEATKKIIKRYLIGTSKIWKGATVFWQIDEKQKVRYGKIMLYNKSTGKRRYRNELEKKSPYINSVSSVLSWKDKSFKKENFNAIQCLFGLHLINETDSKTIAIVEGEKTAILMSLFKPEYTWLATGGKGYFSEKFLAPIKNYKIVAFPDKSEYSLWHSKAEKLNNIGYDIKVSSWLENTNYEKGCDFADILIKEKLPFKTISNVEQDKCLFEKTENIKTPTELLVTKLASKNHHIYKLIDAFELTDKNGIAIKL